MSEYNPHCRLKKYLEGASNKCSEVYKINPVVICWFTVLYYSNENALRHKQAFQMVSEILLNNLGVFKLSKEGAPHFKAFLKEIIKEIKAGNIMQMQPVQFMMNIITFTTLPLIASPLNKNLFQLSDNQYFRLINESKKLIVELLSW